LSFLILEGQDTIQRTTKMKNIQMIQN